VVFDVLVVPPVDVQKRILKYVGGVDPPLLAAVEVQAHHPSKTLAVLAEELRQCMLVARPGLANQDVVTGFLVGHESWLFTRLSTELP
jgi:hypothetical protein